MATEPTNPPPEHLKHYVTPSVLWARHAQRYAAELEQEESARSNAFFDDATAEVCGENLRPLTPHDILILEKLGNPLVKGGRLAEISAEQLYQFLWAVNALNYQGLLSEYRFRRFMKRMAVRVGSERERLGLMVCAAAEFVDRIVQDAPSRKTQADAAREAEGVRTSIGAHFVATLMVPLAMDVGSCDPYDGRPWQFAPLSRIFQYLKVARAREDGKHYADDSPHRGIESEWLADVNAARGSGTLVGENGIPGSAENSHLNAEQVNAAHAG